jgi:hypothetical protein
MRNVVICSGGDWNDAGFKVLEVPDQVDMNDAKAQYDLWRSTQDNKPRDPHVFFVDWLKQEKGCKDSQIEEFWDY